MALFFFRVKAAFSPRESFFIFESGLHGEFLFLVDGSPHRFPSVFTHFWLNHLPIPELRLATFLPLPHLVFGAFDDIGRLVESMLHIGEFLLASLVGCVMLLFVVVPPGLGFRFLHAFILPGDR